MAHLYPLGALVTSNVGVGGPSTDAVLYVIEAQLPPVGATLQYRVKSEAESFRRVVAEHQLAAADAPTAAAPVTDLRWHDEEG